MHKIGLLIVISFLFSCRNTPENSGNIITEDSYKLDPSRELPPYPEIAVPENADTTSPRWKGFDLSPKPPVVPVSPEEERQSFVLKPGYELTPVLTEPNIIEPAAIQFDGNGRMYVLELRSYMQDIDASDELKPLGQISRWEDTNNDGVYDKGVIFLDSLVFPRFVVPFGPNTILVMESNTDVIYKYTDTDGDGQADRKEFFADGMGRSGNVEHQTSFLTWALDNWMYSTYNSKRIRWTPGGVIQESTGNPYGQWGVTQDDYGQTWFQGGASGVPESFQFPMVYGDYDVEGQLEPGFRVPYSLIRLADIEPGMKEVKPDGSLGNVTGAAGNDVFRGHRLPADMYGQYFYGEPVGRIVRRVQARKEEGLTYIQNVYIEDESEFIQSRDPLFRPVDIATAPDGTMYIVDMYRGIIQQGTWTARGSYLRTKIQQYQMDDVIKNGRIWQLTHEGMERDKTQPRMFDETSDELVRHLEHPNGWWRDKAQQLLILRQDLSVVPTLEKMMKESKNKLARIHALWTLEGLGALKADDITGLLKASDDKFRIQVMRAGETLYKYGKTGLAEEYIAMTEDKNPEIVIQALQSIYVLDVKGRKEEIKRVISMNSSKGVQLVGNQLLKNIEDREKMINTRFSKEEQKLFAEGKSIYDGFCAACHGTKGLGTPIGGNNKEVMAPGFSGSPRIAGHPEYVVKTVLHGLKGEIEGKEYESVMAPMGSNNDQYIASVVSYIRNDFGNQAGFVTPDYVARIRKKTGDHKEPYDYEELKNEVPLKLTAQTNWRVTASSTALTEVGATRDPSQALTLRGWRTDGPQTRDAWFQVELPEPVYLAELWFVADENYFPRQYAVQISHDGKEWTDTGHGTGLPGKNIFPVESKDPVRFLKISCLENADKAWGMKDLTLFVRRKAH